MEQGLAIGPASPLLDRSPATLPASAYFDPGHFERERKAIWSRNWVFVGRAEDFAPKRVCRLTVAGQELVMVRTADGDLACYHNTCRHRGAELFSAAETPLKSKLIVCPYHQWSYGLDGRLVRTPFVTTTPDFCADDHALFSVHVREWRGFVFACLADEPPVFEAAFDVAPGTLDNWPLENLVTGQVLVKEIGCNWKIFWENYSECLHCPGIHPSLCETVPVYKRGYMAENEAPDWTPAAPAPHGTLEPGKETWSVDGRLCGPAFAGLTAAQRAAGHTFVTMLPTMYIVAHIDYVRVVSMRPLGPERTELTARWLFDPATLAAHGFDLENVVNFAATVMAEDGDACEMNQRGLRSDRYVHGTLMPQEFEVFRFQQWVRGQTDAAAA